MDLLVVNKAEGLGTLYDISKKGNVSEHAYIVLPGLTRPQLLAGFQQLGVPLINYFTRHCNMALGDYPGEEMPTTLDVLQYDLRLLSYPPDINQSVKMERTSPVGMSLLKKLEWCRIRGASDIATAELTLYFFLRAILQRGRSVVMEELQAILEQHGPWWHICKNMAGDVRDENLCVGWSKEGQLFIARGPGGELSSCGSGFERFQIWSKSTVPYMSVLHELIQS